MESKAASMCLKSDKDCAVFASFDSAHCQFLMDLLGDTVAILNSIV